VKIGTFVLVIMTLFTVSVSFAGDVEKCYGTWANPKYDENYMKSAKYVIQSDGTFEEYRSTTDKNPLVAGTFSVKANWIDAEGNTYFQMSNVDVETPFDDTTKTLEQHYYCLWKLGNTEKTLEVECNTWDYPTELDTGSFYYHIYYRQE